MVMVQGKSTRLSADDWVETALTALAQGGLAAVAVEPLATRLGATKGSFYWHFSSRDALIEAVLKAWVERDTVGVIEAAERQSDPRLRLEELLVLVLRSAHEQRAGGAVELALQATAGHPLVAPVLEQVTHGRLAYLTTVFGQLGFTPAQSRSRALLAYTSYLGHAQVAHATPGELPTGRALKAYVRQVVDLLVGEGAAR